MELLSNHCPASASLRNRSADSCSCTTATRQQRRQRLNRSPSSTSLSQYKVTITSSSKGVVAQLQREKQRTGELTTTSAVAAAAAQATSAADLAIDARDVKVFFDTPQGPKQVLCGATLEVRRGTLHLLLGPNGCGKSTLLRVLGGLLQADGSNGGSGASSGGGGGGSVRMDSPVGFVFQNPDNQVVLPTVAADVAFGLGRYELPPEDVYSRVRHALALVGLGPLLHRPCHTLSGGQKQRVAIAGALAESPRVLLCDELTTFLDAEDQMGVVQAVREVVDSGEGVTALWVTHRLEELQYADSASVMDDAGRIAMTGTPQQAAEYLRARGARI